MQNDPKVKQASASTSSLHVSGNLFRKHLSLNRILLFKKFGFFFVVVVVVFGSAVSLKPWDTGLIPCRAQRVREQVLPRLRDMSKRKRGAAPWPRNSISKGVAQKKAKKKKKKKLFFNLRIYSYYTWFPDISRISITANTKFDLQKFFVAKGEMTQTHNNAGIMP